MDHPFVRSHNAKYRIERLCIEQLEEKFYVYLYRNKGIPIYVGKGQGTRAWDHREWWAKGKQPEIVFRTAFESEASACELALIYKFKSSLINRYNGSMVGKKVRPRDRRSPRKRSVWHTADRIT